MKQTIKKRFKFHYLSAVVRYLFYMLNLSSYFTDPFMFHGDFVTVGLYRIDYTYAY